MHFPKAIITTCQHRMKMELDAIEFTKKTGGDEFVINAKRILLNFWRWAYSHLNGNTERGAIAKYLVAIVFDIEDNIGIILDTYDFNLKNEI